MIQNSVNGQMFGSFGFESILFEISPKVCLQQCLQFEIYPLPPVNPVPVYRDSEAGGTAADSITIVTPASEIIYVGVLTRCRP